MAQMTSTPTVVWRVGIGSIGQKVEVTAASTTVEWLPICAGSAVTTSNVCGNAVVEIDANGNVDVIVQTTSTKGSHSGGETTSGIVVGSRVPDEISY